MKKYYSIVAALLAATMSLPSVVYAEEGGKKEITIAHIYNEENREQSDEGDSMFEMIGKYAEANPDVKIVQSSYEQNDYQAKIQAQAAVKDLPDVFVVKGSWFGNFVDNGVLAPLDDIIDRNQFKEGAFGAALVDDTVYGIPLGIGVTSIIYYNKLMWEEIGYSEFPDTWEGIYEAAAKFNEKGITPFVLGNKDKWPVESCILSALGDRYTGTEWTNSIIAADGQAKFTDPEFVLALEHLQEMVTNNVFNPDFNTQSNSVADDLYAMGKAAATIEGNWTISNILVNGTEDVKNNTGLAVLPAVDGGKGNAAATTGGAGWFVAISSELEGEEKDLVVDFLTSVFGLEYSEYMQNVRGAVGPMLVEAEATKEFTQLQLDYMALMDTLEYTPIYDTLMEGAVIEMMNTKVQDMMNGGISAQEVAEAIQVEQDKVKK